MKRVFIIHGWGGNPQEGWFPWLAEQLRNKGMRAEVPAMPNTDVPEMNAWVQAVAKAVGTPDQETYFVGHSIGCQTILRYLETIQEKVGGAVLVAPFYVLTGLSDEEQPIAKPWLETPINEIPILAVCEHIECVFSDNDTFVPLEENVARFKHHFNAKIVLEHGKGHFSGSDGITQLPSALNGILALTKH